MNNDHDPSPASPLPGESEDSDSALNLRPAGDSSDLRVGDVVGALEFTFPNGDACFILFTCKGLRMAPASPDNRAILSALIGSILPWKSFVEGVGDDRLARILLDADRGGACKTAYIVEEELHVEWLVVSVDDRAIACEFTSARFDQLRADGFHIEIKSRPSSKSTLGL